MDETSNTARLFRARDRVGLSQEKLAALTGLAASHIRELEARDDDLETTLSLSELSRLCRALGTTARVLLGAEVGDPAARMLDSSRLVDLIRDHLMREQLTVAEFENILGWDVSPALHFPDEVLRWSVTELREVCSALGVDWRLAVPE